MNTESEYTEAAHRFADDLLDRYSMHADNLDGIRTMLAIAWLEGSKAGADETMKALRRDLDTALPTPEPHSPTRMIVTREYLKQDGLSDFDLDNMTRIIRDGMGAWFHAELMRALHVLLRHADDVNTSRLEQAYPGSVMAYRIWYNDPVFARVEARPPALVPAG